MGEARFRPASILEISFRAALPFDQPEQKTFRWGTSLSTRGTTELIGLLGTFSLDHHTAGRETAGRVGVAKKHAVCFVNYGSGGLKRPSTSPTVCDAGAHAGTP